MARRQSGVTTSLLVALLSGCAASPPRMELTTFDAAGKPERHHAHFSRAGYRATPGGFLEIAMEAENPSSIDPTQTIRQIIYVRTFWYPQPGRTAVEASQIDAMMMYALLTPPTGIRCDGSAMLTYKWNNEHKTIDVYIESGTLAPRYRMGNAVEPFGPSRFVGRAIVHEDAAQVVQARQFLETQFREQTAAAAASLQPVDSIGVRMPARAEPLFAQASAQPRWPSTLP